MNHREACLSPQFSSCDLFRMFYWIVGGENDNHTVKTADLSLVISSAQWQLRCFHIFSKCAYTSSGVLSTTELFVWVLKASVKGVAFKIITFPLKQAFGPRNNSKEVTSCAFKTFHSGDVPPKGDPFCAGELNSFTATLLTAFTVSAACCHDPASIRLPRS